MVITSETGRYLRSQGMLYLDQHVRLVEQHTTVACDHATYSEDSDILQLIGGVIISDRDAVLEAPSGTYDRRHGRADLYGGVAAADSNQRVTCDRIAYSGTIRSSRRAAGWWARTSRIVPPSRRTRWTTTAGARSGGPGESGPALADKDGRVAEVRAITLRSTTAAAGGGHRLGPGGTRHDAGARRLRPVRRPCRPRLAAGLAAGLDDETIVTGDTLESGPRTGPCAGSSCGRTR